MEKTVIKLTRQQTDTYRNGTVEAVEELFGYLRWQARRIAGGPDWSERYRWETADGDTVQPTLPPKEETPR
jgi:hypothetical protein